MAMQAVHSPSESPEAAARPRTRTPAMVLVVGDDYESFDTIARALRADGLSALCVGTPREALNVIAEARVALVIFDLDQPDISSPDAIRWLLPSLDSPVFLMGSDEALERHFEAWRAGAAGLITRPIDPELVVKQVAAVLSGSDGDDAEQEVLFGPDGLTMYLRACVVAYRGVQRVRAAAHPAGAPWRGTERRRALALRERLRDARLQELHRGAHQPPARQADERRCARDRPDGARFGYVVRPE